MKDIRVKTKGLVIGVSLFHLFTFSPMANAQQRSWTADNGNGTYTNPLFYDEFSDPDILRVGEPYRASLSSIPKTLSTGRTSVIASTVSTSLTMPSR